MDAPLGPITTTRSPAPHTGAPARTGMHTHAHTPCTRRHMPSLKARSAFGPGPSLGSCGLPQGGSSDEDPLKPLEAASPVSHVRLRPELPRRFGAPCPPLPTPHPRPGSSAASHLLLLSPEAAAHVPLRGGGGAAIGGWALTGTSSSAWQRPVQTGRTEATPIPQVEPRATGSGKAPKLTSLGPRAALLFKASSLITFALRVSSPTVATSYSRAYETCRGSEGPPGPRSPPWQGHLPCSAACPTPTGGCSAPSLCPSPTAALDWPLLRPLRGEPRLGRPRWPACAGPGWTEAQTLQGEGQEWPLSSRDQACGAELQKVLPGPRGPPGQHHSPVWAGDRRQTPVTLRPPLPGTLTPHRAVTPGRHPPPESQRGGKKSPKYELCIGSPAEQSQAINNSALQTH